MTYESLKKPSEFSKVYKRGKSFVDKYLVMYILPNKLGYTRVGLSVSKKVGNSVRRNRVKRLIRESFRLNYLSDNSYDIIFIARVRSNNADYFKIEKSMKFLLNKMIRKRD
ncbi:ribonuclease P protein component [Fusibacter ferrireducens]|uniref:Ribonuclease P protein component n=1 Tax=Fusibacter ferrireducens TaxID=2785058 RepID=A0ABR9ZYA7_9FIRM|nr:ribonuclease P protein component [Fusibacter ferrireducens]MBF4695437.1 ribonuclease P protein component [Fusibacter ferrireducens]